MQRPTSVTVLGILNLIFAAFGVWGFAIWAAMSYMPLAVNVKSPLLEIIAQNATYAAYINISMVLGAGVTVILGLAGIGLLMLRPWGRWLSIGYGIYTILQTIVNLTVNCYVVVGPLIAKEAALPPGAEKVAASMGIVGIFTGSCFGLVYPIILLIFMFRPNVIEAMRTSKPADPFRV